MGKVTEVNWIIEETRDENEFGAIGIDISAPDAHESNILTIWIGAGATEKETMPLVQLVVSAPDLLKACIEAEKHHQGLHSEIGTMLRDVINQATSK